MRLTKGVEHRGDKKNGDSLAASPGDHSLALLPEDLFIRLLSVERKRAERSRRQFVLMLVQLGRTPQIEKRESVFQKVLLALSRSTRETDVRGWYQRDSIIGVILTEIDPTDINAVLNAVHNKVSIAMRVELNLRQVNDIHISFHLFPEDWDSQDEDSPADAKLYPDLLNGHPKRVFHIVKRAMDLVGSVIALILFAPLFLLIAAAIKLTSKGPVLFKQERVGQYGRKFTFLKFRSMHLDSNPKIHQDFTRNFISGKIRSPGNQVPFKLTLDPRVTPLGRWLRKTSLDELPQLINVLRGQMSLVGPRPPIPYELQSYDQWHRRRLLEAKPGITGLWQVKGRSKTKFDDMVRLDLEYARTWSPWLDLKILLRTPWAVLSAEGAY